MLAPAKRLHAGSNPVCMSKIGQSQRLQGKCQHGTADRRKNIRNSAIWKAVCFGSRTSSGFEPQVPDQIFGMYGSGILPRSERGNRWFESNHPDQCLNSSSAEQAADNRSTYVRLVVEVPTTHPWLSGTARPCQG